MFGSSNFMNMSDPSFLSTTETFHTPSLGDEDLEIPPMSALGDPSEELGLPGVDPSAVDEGGVVVQAFGGSLQSVAGGGIPDIGRTAIGGHPGSSAGGVIGRDFSPHFPPAQGLELPSLAIAGGLLSAEPALLDATLDMDTSPYVHAHSPHMSMAGLIHQPPQLQLQQHQQQQQQHQQQHQQQPQRTTLQLRSHSLAGSHGGLSGPLGSMGIPHGQLTTIDQSHLGLGHGSPSPPSSKSPTPSPCSSLEPAEDPEEAARVALEKRQLVELQRKVKPSKRKKKKDPNEPLKPLSAYALFFRDTQAAIKGQNASATFGEVSKIVASMWDSLGEEQKQVYKRKAEAAKKDYLKALAAYKDGLLPQAALDPTDGELLSALQKSPGAPPAHIVLAPAATPMPPPLQPMPQVMMRPVVATHANASGGGGGAGAGVMMAGAGPAGTGGRAVGTSSVSAMGMPPPPPLMSAPHYHQRLAAQQQQQQQQMLMEQQIVLQGPMNQRPPLVVQQHQQIHVHSLVSDDLQTVQVTPLVSDSDVVMVSEPMEVQSACEEQTGADGGIGGAGVDEVAEPEGGVAAGADDSAASADDAMQIEPMEGGGAVVQRMVEVAQQPLPLTPAAAARAATEAPVTVVQQVVQQMAQQVLVQAVAPASPPAAAGTEKSPARVECLPAPSPPHAVVTVTAEVAVSRCVRTGCNNPSVESVDWDNEYCSSECVVSHCRDVFMAWVAARTQATTATVK